MSICKDCQPVFYKLDELPPGMQLRPGSMVLKHVELCPLHASAQELLSACKDFEAEIAGRFPKGDAGLQGMSEQLRKAVIQTREAIAKAEGLS